MREYSLDQVNIPRMYFQEQSVDFKNKRNYLSQDFKRITTAAALLDTEASSSSGPAPKRPIDSSTTHDTSSKRMKSA